MGADRDLERQLGQAARAAPAAVAGRAQARRGLPAGDQAGRRRVSPSCSATSWPSAGTRSPSTARRPGTGWRSCRASGSTTWSRGSPARPGFPDPEARAVSATCGGIRVVSVYVPNGREPDSEHYRVQARVAGGAAGHGRRGPRGDDRLRRHEHRPDRRRRLRSRRPTSARRTSRRPSARRSRSCRRSACATSCATAGRASASSPTGTTGPGCSTRTSGCGSTWCSPARRSPSGCRRPGSTARRARASGPSDHAPVIVDLDEAPDGDIGPVVPPPSARSPSAARRSCRRRR